MKKVKLKGINVFGSARFKPGSKEYVDIYNAIVQTLLVNKDIQRVKTGGGPGAMAAANQAAQDIGVSSVGISIDFLKKEQPNEFLDIEVTTSSFEARKRHIVEDDVIYICTPGGAGTLDEFFEVMTLIQTGVHKNTYIVLLDEKFWTDLINWDRLKEWKTIGPKDTTCFLLCSYEHLPQTIKDIREANYE